MQVVERLWQQFQDLIGGGPETALAVAMAAVAVVAVLLGAVIGVGVGRRRGRPHDESAAAPEGGASHTDVAAQNAESEPANPAFASYQRVLEEKNVPAKEQDAMLRDFAGHLEEMRRRLVEMTGGDEGLESTVSEARQALDAGDFMRVMKLLNQVGQDEADRGRKQRREADARVMTAALAWLVSGDLALAQREPAVAQEFYRLAVETVPQAKDELLAECLNKHGTAAYQSGDMDGAAISFSRALKLLERRHGLVDPNVATGLNNLALIHYARGDLVAAEPLYKRSLEIDEQLLGEDAPGVATDLNNLALLYKKQGRLEEAEPLLARALRIKEQTFPPGHPSLSTGLRNYASLLKALGRDDEAAVLENRATALPPRRGTGSSDRDDLSQKVAQ